MSDICPICEESTPTRGMCAFCTADSNRQSKRRYDQSLKGKFRSLRHTGRDVQITFEQFSHLLTLPCAYCGGECTSSTGYSLDRKDNAKGYLLENVAPCCTLCNKMKTDEWSFEEFLQIGAVVRRLKEERCK